MSRKLSAEYPGPAGRARQGHGDTRVGSRANGKRNILEMEVDVGIFPVKMR